MVSYADLLVRLREAIRENAKDNGVLALMMVSLDSVAQVDGALGYESGDRVLTRAAKRIHNVLRSSDVVGSIGRGQYGCILTGLSAESLALLAAEKLLREFDEPFDVIGTELRITPQVGIAFLTEHANNASELLRCANVAMQEAKRRNKPYRVFEWGDEDLLALQFHLQTDLARAIDNTELRLIYQPQLNLNSNKITGAEALLRWTHPAEGPVSASEILYVAERSGLMSRLTDWMISSALRQCADCRQQNLDIGVSINVSALKFPDSDIAEMLDRALGLWGIPANRVVVELNESIGLTQALDAMPELERLKGLGVRLAADGFGMEQSSLMRLRELPIDEIKISRSFVTDMLLGESNKAIVRSMIDIGHNLGMQVVANGVGNTETREALRLMGCDVVQGAVISPPLPFNELVALAQMAGNP